MRRSANALQPRVIPTPTAEDDEPLLAADRRRHASRARELLAMIEEGLERTVNREGDA